jgi:hypothetical protein
MSDDFYVKSGNRQWEILQGARRQALNNLEDQKLFGSQDDAASALQDLATIDSQIRDLADLGHRYNQSQTPPPPPTLEERRAKPWEKMDYSDVWEMSKSKYGPPDEASFRAGIAEAQRRRQRGE